MSVKTTDQFFELLEKSDILGEAKLARAKELTTGTGSVKDVARQLIKADLLTKWQAANLLSGKSKLTIGKYRLLGQIGGASTGNVFLAEHAQMNRRVALKALVHRDHSPEATQQFLKQARAVSSLEHPNLTRAYDIDIQDQYYYLVLEHVQGRTVEKFLKDEGKFEPHAAAKHIRQAADALAYAHGKGLLHRDIRPTNLMISTDGDLKVLNLGVVKLSDPADTPAADSTEAADLEHATYLSPEQARGSENIEARSDIYSLGCVMFAMLTGQPPLSGKTYGEIVKKHQTGAPKKILDLNPELNRDLAKICLKMLGKKREDRFQSAAQIVKFLDKWLDANAPAKPAKPPVTATPTAASTPVEPLETPASNKPPVAAQTTSEPEAFEPAADDFAVAVADAPAPAVGGFAINTEPKGKRKKKPAAKAAPAASPEGEASPASNSNKALIIGGAVGGGLLALAAVVLIVMFVFSGDDPDEIAQTDPNEEPAAVAEEGDPAATTDDTASEEVDPEAEASDAANADAADPATEPTPPAEEEPEEDLAALLGKSNSEPPAEEPAETTEEPEEENPAGEPAESEPSEEEPSEEQPAEAESPPEQAPPADAKPKRTPQQVKEPLKQLVARVALPPLEIGRGDDPPVGVGATASLGKVFDPADEPVFAELLGTDQIGKATVTYELEREVASAVENRKWTVIMKNQRDEDERKALAEFAIKDFELTFRWLEDAGTAVNDANALRNCMFLVILGKDQEQAVALRTPQRLEPIAVNLSGRRANEQADLDDIPEKEALQIQVTKVEGFPQKVSLPPTPFQVDGGSGAISIGEPGQETVSFQMKVNMRGRRPTVSVSPFFKLTGMNSYEPFVTSRLEEIYKNQIIQQKGATEFLRKKNIPRQDQARAEQALTIANAAIPELTAIKSYQEALAESGKIHYEVIYTIGRHQMVIGSTQAQ